MNVIRTSATTNSDGTLTLTLPLGQPDTQFELAVIAQPQPADGSTTQPVADSWAAINAFRERIAASGRVFTDSVELVREDRDR